MGIDTALWEMASTDAREPVVRFYWWNPPAVSLGSSQEPDLLVNQEFCRASGIPVVRRPTGGSAIFHDIELTYAVIAPTDAHPLFGQPLSAYLSICEALRRGISSLGVDLCLRGASSGKEPAYTSEACFVLSSRHDLVKDGRKVVGSAQRWNQRAFLQHGSIVLDIREELWKSVFRTAPNLNRTGALSRLLGTPVDRLVLAGHLAEGFSSVFGVEMREAPLSPAESARAEQLAGERFSPL